MSAPTFRRIAPTNAYEVRLDGILIGTVERVVHTGEEWVANRIEWIATDATGSPLPAPFRTRGTATAALTDLIEESTMTDTTTTEPDPNELLPIPSERMLTALRESLEEGIPDGIIDDAEEAAYAVLHRLAGKLGGVIVDPAIVGFSTAPYVEEDDVRYPVREIYYDHDIEGFPGEVSNEVSQVNRGDGWVVLT